MRHTLLHTTYILYTHAHRTLSFLDIYIKLTLFLVMLFLIFFKWGGGGGYNPVNQLSL